mmetsp:Transcript_9586/g.17183  ORF Transcript_9586/g.17183 Transcript_9586/m.17183 type:complete len:126 (-) Transcript_9586:271-648(-)|eukprot:CAMPEP_0197641696 /NCGR_PEP_ID=MMETSP1338-20131121/15588_1 /TAXON_ID=43686 ORGANISM="Pelagodinium beii, Strain RCC1491" /NCGR_SAMPLE_ID=MMETSP1338 /ASSEMBLY_ACC=CAM_ASM_000754 /LENGTH=125 /DNA_ID=CAMNT_0043214725 /DNA_START=67 /DNA_END=444 /DNA_ORIENTATION=+
MGLTASPIMDVDSPATKRRRCEEKTFQEQLEDATSFEKAVALVRDLPASSVYVPSEHTRLAFYKYYKQATVGPCQDIEKPCLWRPEERMRWTAWEGLEDMPAEQAKAKYVALLQAVGRAVLASIH